MHQCFQRKKSKKLENILFQLQMKCQNEAEYKC